MAGTGWIDGKELFPNRALLCSEKMAKKGQPGLKPWRWTPQRLIPEKNVASVSPTQVPLAPETAPKPGWHKIPRTAWKNQGIPFSTADSGCSWCDGGTPHRICSRFHLGLCGRPCWARGGMGHPRSRLDFRGRRRGNGREGGWALGVSPFVHPSFSMDGTK